MLSEIQLNADVDFMVADLPDRDGTQMTVVLVDGGASYPATRTSVRREEMLMTVGMQDRYRFSIYVNGATVDAAGERPEIQEVVTITSEGVEQRYTVLDTVDDNIKQLLRLDLGEEFASV